MASPKTARTSIAACRAVLAGMTRSGVKSAELGGDGNDAEFEQAFSNLAHAYLRDKAPSLQDYELGFQLLDRNQDNTKAVGIFGFKIGNQLVYAPAFFLNGDLKGHELLYLKDQDQFVPMKENWLMWILNKKPNVLGEPIDRNSARIGVTPPDLASMKWSPTKYGSAGLRDMAPGVAAFAHFALTSPYSDPKYAHVGTLQSFLQKEGRAAIGALVRGLMGYPSLAEKFASDFGGLELIRQALAAAPERILTGVLADKEAGVKRWAMGDTPPKRMRATEANGGKRSDGRAAWDSTDGYVRNPGNPNRYLEKEAASGTWTIGADGRMRPKYVPKAHRNKGVMEAVGQPSQNMGQPSQPAEIKDAVLRIITLDRFDPQSDLSAPDRERLLRDGALFFDKRAEDEVSVAYAVDTTLTLTNPTVTGVYDLLVKPGEFEKCLVAMSPVNRRGRRDFATVVRIDGERAWLNVHPSRLWVRQRPNDSGTELKDWVAGLPEPTGISSSWSAVHMLIGPSGEATCPFQVEEVASADGPIKTYNVSFRDRSEGGRPDFLPPVDRSSNYREDFSYGLGERLTLTDREGAQLRAGNGDVFVPKGFKLLTIRPDTDSEDRRSEGRCCSPMSRSKEPPPILPGGNPDLQRAIFKVTTSLKVAHFGTEVHVDSVSMSPLGALIYLVRERNLRVKQAKAIVREAERHRVVRYRVKEAQPGYMVDPGPVAPGFPNPPYSNDPATGGVPTMGPMEQQLPIASQTPQMPNVGPEPMPDPGAMQSVMTAAQTGQREVLDTAAIGSILKTVRDDTMIDRHIPDLMKGLDRLGRILFSLYWHGDKFQDRFGKQDMPELEDGLRNSFESLGDVVLELKQKTIAPFPDEMAHADLQDTAA